MPEAQFVTMTQNDAYPFEITAHSYQVTAKSLLLYHERGKKNVFFLVAVGSTDKKKKNPK